MKRLLQRLRWWWHQPLNQIVCLHAWAQDNQSVEIEPADKPGQRFTLAQFTCRRCDARKLHIKEIKP